MGNTFDLEAGSEFPPLGFLKMSDLGEIGKTSENLYNQPVRKVARSSNPMGFWSYRGKFPVRSKLKIVWSLTFCQWRR